MSLILQPSINIWYNLTLNPIDIQGGETEVAVKNALGHSRQADYHAVPSCIFTQPEIAGVGITEAEANDSGIPHKVSKFSFVACGRAVAMNETMGVVKMICNAENGRVLGMHIMGPVELLREDDYVTYTHRGAYVWLT